MGSQSISSSPLSFWCYFDLFCLSSALRALISVDFGNGVCAIGSCISNSDSQGFRPVVGDFSLAALRLLPASNSRSQNRDRRTQATTSWTFPPPPPEVVIEEVKAIKDVGAIEYVSASKEVTVMGNVFNRTLGVSSVAEISPKRDLID